MFQRLTYFYRVSTKSDLVLPFARFASLYQVFPCFFPSVYLGLPSF